MNKLQENKLSMYMLIEKVCMQNSRDWNNFEPMKNAVEGFKGVINRIQNEYREQTLRYKGVRDEKNETLSTLIDTSLYFVSALKLHALAVNNRTLHSEVSFTQSDLLRTRDTLTIDKCRFIYNYAVKHADELAIYEVTEEMLNDFNAQIKHYRKTFNDLTDVRNTKKLATEKMKALFKEADFCLNNQLDLMIFMKRNQYPELYRKYMGSRKILHSGTRHRKNDDMTDIDLAA